MKLCMWHSYMPLVHFRPSLPIFTKVNSNFTNRTALSGPSRPKLAILYSKHTHWCTKVHIVEIRRLSMSKQYAKIRIELSVHTAANGLRKDVECGETQISVRFRRKITLLVNKLTLHAQLLTARGDNSFLIFACCFHNLWRLLCAVGVVVHTSVHR